MTKIVLLFDLDTVNTKIKIRGLNEITQVDLNKLQDDLQAAVWSQKPDGEKSDPWETCTVRLSVGKLHQLLLRRGKKTR